MIFIRVLSFFALIVLGLASIWMGGLNQDEGWYLYAANLVSEGLVPYRDFFFTQGPVMPYVYSAFVKVWQSWGLLGARGFTLLVGVVGIVVAMALARRLVPEKQKCAAGLMVLILLGCNLYHLYYLTIPKTYALASLLVMVGFYLLSYAVDKKWLLAFASGLAFAFACGTRISLGAMLPVIGVWLLLSRQWKVLWSFVIGASAGLALVYLPFILSPMAREGLCAAQAYHAARSGFDVVWVVGSLSRLVRWYLPVFVVLGLWINNMIQTKTYTASRFTVPLVGSFIAVFAVQMLAPFPYEDYQVPIMGVLAIAVAVGFSSDSKIASAHTQVLLVLGMTFACSFGSPLLEKWTTNGQDRFWSLKKNESELSQLRKVAKQINKLDPEGKSLLTQDLYLAIETGRKVPKGLEMGPFSMLDDAEWKKLLAECDCPIAALSGYSFAIEPPKCNERDISTQMEYWNLLKRNYSLVEQHETFGQNSTPLLILKHK